MKGYDDDIPVSRPVYHFIQAIYMSVVAASFLTGLTYSATGTFSIRFAIETFLVLFVLCALVFVVVRGAGTVLEGVFGYFGAGDS